MKSMKKEYSLDQEYPLNYISIHNSFRPDMAYKISVKHASSINLLDKISEVWMKVF